MRRGLALLCCLLLPAGCGTERARPPDLLSIQAPRGTTARSFPAAGIELRAPANWTLRERSAPGVFALTSGEAVVVAWAYPRKEQLPTSGQSLRAAQRRLLAEVRERDSRFDLERASRRRLDGAPAIELRGEQTISKRRLRVRSVHAFRGDGEYVLELLAPPADFDRVDRTVFEPLLRSMELSGRMG